MPNDQTPTRISTDPPTRAIPESRPESQGTRTWLYPDNPGMNIWARSNAALLGQMGELAKTMHQFRQSRLQANIDAWQTLASCRDPAELAVHQHGFMKTATAQYSRHAQTMFGQAIAMGAAATSQAALES